MSEISSAEWRAYAQDSEREISTLHTRIAALEAQLAEARRPEMVRDEPTQKGFYWRRIGANTQPCVVFVSREQGLWVYEVPGHPGTIGIWHDEDVFWSAKPIPYDPMPKEEPT